MRNKVLCIFSLLGLGATTMSTAQTAVKDSVIMGQNYANEVYYTLDDGTQSSVNGDDWHLMFSTDIRSVGISSNAKNSTVKKWPNGDNGDFSIAIDTTGFSSWEELKNDPADYEVGAFNQNPSGSFNYGWGTYSPSTHKVTGDSIYLVTVGDSALYKVDVISLTQGVMTFRYALYDATDQGTEIDIDGANYNTKDFVFFNLVDGQVKDRELEGWDLWFLKYHDLYQGQSIEVVTGVLTNPKLEVAKVDVGSGNQATANNFFGSFFSNDKNVIGETYKSLNYNNFEWEVTDSLVYYIKDTASGNVWKWYPTKFVGQSEGKTVFMKEQVGFAGLSTEKTQFLDVYPNPMNNKLTVVFDSKANKANIELYNSMGQVMLTNLFDTSNGNLTEKELDVSSLKRGLYFVRISQNGQSTVQKVIKN